VQFSTPVFLCSKHQQLVPGLLKAGELLRGSGTSEAVAASKLISSAVGEQVSLEYTMGWCRSKNTHGEVKCAPNRLTAVKHLGFFARSPPVQAVFLLPPNGILNQMHLPPSSVINFRPVGEIRGTLEPEALGWQSQSQWWPTLPQARGRITKSLHFVLNCTVFLCLCVAIMYIYIGFFCR